MPNSEGVWVDPDGNVIEIYLCADTGVLCGWCEDLPWYDTGTIHSTSFWIDDRWLGHVPVCCFELHCSPGKWQLFE